LHEANQLPDGSLIEAIIISQAHIGPKPELCLDPVLQDVNMNGLARSPFVGKEVELEPAVAKDDG
jgi:hypothetical protein